MNFFWKKNSGIKAKALSFVLFQCMMLLAIVGRTNAQMSILQARQAGTGQVVTVVGVVTSGPELGTIRYIQDSTAAIGVYSTQVANWIQGDSVMVSGTISEYFGLLEISAPISLDTVLKQNAMLPATKRIQLSELGEAYEGQLVTVKKVFFPAGGTQIVGGSSYQVKNATDSTNAYFRLSSPLVGVTLPSDTVDLTGICSQYTQYQILLRSDDAWVPWEPDPVTGSASPKWKNAAKIFPNPVSEGDLWIQLPEGNNFQVEIRDATGRLLSASGASPESNRMLRLSVEGLPKGLLFICISNQDHIFRSTILHL